MGKVRGASSDRALYKTDWEQQKQHYLRECDVYAEDNEPEASGAVAVRDLLDDVKCKHEVTGESEGHAISPL